MDATQITTFETALRKLDPLVLKIAESIVTPRTPGQELDESSAKTRLISLLGINGIILEAEPNLESVRNILKSLKHSGQHNQTSQIGRSKETDDFTDSAAFPTGISRYREDMSTLRLAIPTVIARPLADALNQIGAPANTDVSRRLSDNIKDMDGIFISGDATKGKIDQAKIISWLIISSPEGFDNPIILQASAAKKPSLNRAPSPYNNYEISFTALNAYTGERVFEFKVDPRFDPTEFKSAPVDSVPYGFNSSLIARKIDNSTWGSKHPSDSFKYRVEEKEILKVANSKLTSTRGGQSEESALYTGTEGVTLFTRNNLQSLLPEQDRFAPDLSRCEGRHVAQQLKAVDWKREMLRFVENDFNRILAVASKPEEKTAKFILSDNVTTCWISPAQIVSDTSYGFSGRSTQKRPGYT